MKEIIIKGIEKKGELYSIPLGNGVVKEFPSKRESLKFLASVKNFLTEKLHELFQMYIDSWNSYAENWFYDSHFYKKRPAVEGEINECKLLLRTISEHFDSVTQKNLKKGNKIVFSHFNQILDDLKKITKILSSIYKKKANTVGVYKMDVFLKRIAYCSRELNGFGRFNNSDYLNVPTHKSMKTDQL